MADDLSARLRRETIPVLRSRAEVAARNGLVTPVYALDLLTLLDALDAAPPPERVLPAPLTLAEIHEVAAACAAVQPIHNSYVEVQLDLDTWAKFRAALSPDSGADPTPEDHADFDDLDCVDLDVIWDQEAKGWPDFHPETFCHRCGHRNVASWFVGNRDWNLLRVARVLPASEIICPSCFTDLYEKLTSPCTWELVLRVVHPDSGADPEPQRVIVDFAEVEPQHSPLRTWPTDPEPQP